eukprot:3440175-Lingulodinium_polyedra.AAC.1
MPSPFTAQGVQAWRRLMLEPGWKPLCRRLLSAPSPWSQRPVAQRVPAQEAAALVVPAERGP